MKIFIHSKIDPILAASALLYFKRYEISSKVCSLLGQDLSNFVPLQYYHNIYLRNLIKSI